jgi:outer membrane protein TolC
MKKKILVGGVLLPAFMFANSISFSEALDKTLQNNKELKAKKLAIKKAKQEVILADGYNYGQVTVSESIARTNNPMHVFGMKLGSREATFGDFGFSEFLTPLGTAIYGASQGQAPSDMSSLLQTQPDDLNNPDARNNFETKVTYEVPLFTGFKLTNAKTMAKLQVRANEVKYLHDEKQLGLEVLKAYNGAVAAKYFIKATQNAKEATKSFVEFASQMYAEGLVTQIEVKQAQVYDLGVDAKIKEAQNQYKLALAYLRFLTDEPNITDVKEFKTMTFESDDLNVLQTSAIEQRDDYQWMQLNVKTLQTKVKFDSAAKYPMIGAKLEYGFNDDELNNINSDKDYYVAGVGLEYKLFDGYQTSVAVQKAKIEHQKVLHYLEYMKNGIKLQVEKNYLTLHAKEDVLEQKVKAKDLADEVLKQSKEMYKNSLINMTNLLQQQANAQKAEAEAILSKYEHTIAAAKLTLSIGKSLKDNK